MHLIHTAQLRIHIDSVMLNEILCGTYMFPVKEIPVKRRLRGTIQVEIFVVAVVVVVLVKFLDYVKQEINDNLNVCFNVLSGLVYLTTRLTCILSNKLIKRIL